MSSARLQTTLHDAFNPLTNDIKEQILLSRPHTSCKSTGGKLLKYQENSPWVIISLILITSGVVNKYEITKRNLMLILFRA